MMTLDEMKLAVCEKLPEAAVKLFHIDWLDRSKRWEYIDWAVMGLQVCHEAEKLLNEKESVWYLQKLSQIRLRMNESGTIAVILDRLAFATYEQRLEAICRVWFPERFK